MKFVSLFLFVFWGSIIFCMFHQLNHYLCSYFAEDNLFGGPGEVEDEDSPFNKKGLFSASSGGLFDDDEKEEVRNKRTRRVMYVHQPYVLHGWTINPKQYNQLDCIFYPFINCRKFTLQNLAQIQGNGDGHFAVELWLQFLFTFIHLQWTYQWSYFLERVFLIQKCLSEQLNFELQIQILLTVCIGLIWCSRPTAASWSSCKAIVRVFLQLLHYTVAPTYPQPL